MPRGLEQVPPDVSNKYLHTFARRMNHLFFPGETLICSFVFNNRLRNPITSCCSE